MIRNLKDEIWVKVKFDDKISLDENYLISNYGRLIRDIDGKKELKKLPTLRGYEVVGLKQREKGKYTNRCVHKLVGENFIPKDNDDQKFVIHLDYDKANNHVSNLKWATKREKEIHQTNNPVWKEALKNKNKNYYKLNEGKVKIIKRQLKNKKNRITMIARRFGVSDMQIHRIKTGENWGHVTID